MQVDTRQEAPNVNESESQGSVTVQNRTTRYEMSNNFIFE